MELLRSHRRGNLSDWSPDRGFTGADICMHAGVGPVRINETTGSMVSELGQKDQLHWFTGTAAPCTGIFKPVWFNGGLPDIGPMPTGKFDTKSLWWTHEQLHRQVILDYALRISLYDGERDQLENSFISGVEALYESPNAEKMEYSKACFEKAYTATIRWLRLAKSAPIQKGVPSVYRAVRRKFDDLALLPD
jgi:dipeptidase